MSSREGDISLAPRLTVPLPPPFPSSVPPLLSPYSRVPFVHAFLVRYQLYEGGFFKAKLEFPKDFPNNPPTMTFVSEMFHPNGASLVLSLLLLLPLLLCEGILLYSSTR